MLRRISPYQLLAFFAMSLSLLLVFKMNKLSFYDHYFKVIEDVETRNSQEVEGLDLRIDVALPSMSFEQQLREIFPLSFLQDSLSPFSFLSFELPSQLNNLEYCNHIPLIVSELYDLVQPARAP